MSRSRKSSQDSTTPGYMDVTIYRFSKLLRTMAELKELRRLRDEEKTLVSIATKLSDQLNRLKVEELALLSMLRQNQGETGHVPHVDPQREEKSTQDMDTEHVETPQLQSESEIKGEKKLVPLDLNVGQGCDLEEEEEEDEEEDDEDDDVTADLSMMINELN